jgi:hypothetical protein
VVLKDLESALRQGGDCDPVGSELPSHNGFPKRSDP